MKFLVYAMKDTKSGFLTPTFELNDSIAIRNFRLAMSKDGTVFHFTPEDFELWKIASYDTENGFFEDIEPKYITNGKE